MKSGNIVLTIAEIQFPMIGITINIIFVGFDLDYRDYLNWNNQYFKVNASKPLFFLTLMPVKDFWSTYFVYSQDFTEREREEMKSEIYDEKEVNKIETNFTMNMNKTKMTLQMSTYLLLSMNAIQTMNLC